MVGGKNQRGTCVPDSAALGTRILHPPGSLSGCGCVGPANSREMCMLYTINSISSLTTHTHINVHIHFILGKKKKACYFASAILFGYSIPLLVLVIEIDWVNILRELTVMTPRPLDQVFTESSISIFPALRKTERESTWSLLSLLLADMPSLN